MNQNTGMYPMRKFLSRPFKIDIVVIFCLILIPTVMVIATYSYYKNSRAALSMANRLVEKITASVVDKTTNYMLPAQRISMITSSLLKESGYELKPDSMLERYLVSIVRNQPQIAIAYYGSEKGEFLKADHLDKSRPMLTKFVSGQSDKQAFVLERYLNENNDLLEEKKVNNVDYDPRGRPWYAETKSAMVPYWTEPYIFVDSGRPGISAACPVANAAGILKGVVAMDISLGELSEFMRTNRISDNGLMFIMDQNNKLIAFPDSERMLDIVDGKIVTVRVEELKEQWIRTAVRRNEDNNETHFSYESGGKTFLAYFSKFPETFGKEWQIVVIAPEDDFLGLVKATHRATLKISGVILCIAILVGFIFARNLSKPIEQLTKEVRKIQDFNLEGKVNIPSFIYEIRMLSNALDSMKTGLMGFGRYVPGELVRELIKSGEEVTPGGREIELTLFFSDITGFTSIAEEIPARELMVNLSEYLDIMTKVILEEKGTVDKYIGDAVMAFWGAPIANEAHALCACRAALICQRFIDDLNRRWHDSNRLPFKTRMGLHTDFTIVGNMGSEERLSYSVIGDGVNLASRLESVNKIYNTGIIISQSTFRYVRNEFILRPLDIITVKGKSKSIKIYELMGDDYSDGKDGLTVLSEGFTKAYGFYLRREWAEALDIFEQLREAFPNDRPVELYIERCCSFIAADPGEAWCGITKINTSQESAFQ